MPPTHLAHTLLLRAHSPIAAESIFTTKIKQKPLPLHPTQPPHAKSNGITRPTDSRSLRRHIRLHKREYFLRKQCPKPLSAKEKRTLGLRNLPGDELKYSVYLGLHKLWIEYMHEVLGLNNTAAKAIDPQQHGILLATADFHGAEVEVVKSICVDRVGIRGIVVRDTKFTFVVITEKDEVRTLPKGGTVFRYVVPLPNSNPEEKGVKGEYVFELHGSQFQMRAVDRATRKFKWNGMMEL